MTHLIVLTILIAAVFAIYESRLITMRIGAGYREELDHAELMGWRAAAWLTGAALLMAFDAVTWRVVLWSILPCLAAFAMTHRFTLNKAHKSPWWWMGLRLGVRRNSASSYDAMWHWTAWRLRGGKMWGILHIYPNDLPAKLAYWFEAAVLAVFVVAELLS